MQDLNFLPFVQKKKEKLSDRWQLMVSKKWSIMHNGGTGLPDKVKGLRQQAHYYPYIEIEARFNGASMKFSHIAEKWPWNISIKECVWASKAMTIIYPKC